MSGCAISLADDRDGANSYEKGAKDATSCIGGRHFLPVLIHMVQNYFGLGEGHNRLMFNCLSCLQDCYAEIKSWKGDGSNTRDLGCHARRHMALYAELQRFRTDELTFRWFPQHHMWLHLADNSLKSPAVEWCYGDETEIGRCSHIAAAVHPNRIHDLMLERYRLTFELL